MKAVASKAGVVSTVCSVEVKAVASTDGMASTFAASPKVLMSRLALESNVVCVAWYSLIFVSWALKLAPVSIGLDSAKSVCP